MTVVVGVAIVDGRRVLAARRAHPPEIAGGWEFPGGKVGVDEEPADAAVREIAEELGCDIEVAGWLPGSVEIKPGLVLRVATASLVGREPVPREHDIIRWLAVHQLDEVTWLPADVPFLEPLKEVLR